MLLLTLSVSVGALKPPECVGKVCPRASLLQVGVYFGGLYIIAFGNGGTKPNISTIGADQFDDFDAREKSHKLSFFNWWMFTIFVGILFSSTVLVYLQDNVSWSVGYGIPTLGLIASIAIFLAGTPVYRHKLPQGSAFTRMGKVVGAALRKWRLPVPADAKELHELELEAYTKKHKFRMDSTNSMRFLNKAAVKDVVDGSSSRAAKWSLCTVTEVEETKQISLLTRMGIGLLVQVLTMGTASLIESQRLSYARSRGLDVSGGKLRLSIFVLLPQFVLMGLADAFLVVGKIEFFYDQAPESMKSLGTALSLTAYGVGNFLSSFILSLVTRVTRRRGSPWVADNLNAAHLDYYYAFLTLLAAANCVVFAVLAHRYRYRAESTDTIDVDMDVHAQREAAKKIHSEPMA
ncbi:unnamed protein product [Triticum turgidum subsp. durum]|uniref:Uncharacterized protein n=1 Tax=Triticum turgidum subsp. durum TaxID=4567 RepID=A0A9R0TDK4_TRITD|nr:unnamed protein product [Triticum turgidum subsp. durum]